MMTGNTAIHIASQLQSGAPRKAAFLVAVQWCCAPAAMSSLIISLMSSARFARHDPVGR